MAVRPKDRFEVFKRDGFVCAYCGKHPPEATLEVDHIIPHAEGGSDWPENLVTACWDCNRGKGARPLDALPAEMPDLAQRAALIHERELQLRAYQAELDAATRRRESVFNEVLGHWYEVWGETELERYYLPWDSALRHYISILGAVDVMASMDSTRRKFGYITTNAVRYFMGILKHKAGERGDE